MRDSNNETGKSSASFNNTSSTEELKKEIEVLTKKNYGLAKTVSTLKINCKHIEDERNHLQSECMRVIIEKREFEKRMNVFTKNVLDLFVKFSNELSTVLCNAQVDLDGGGSSAERVSENGKPNFVTASPNNRTHAVKPMVSGHVIHRPIINLPRVPTEELVRMGASIYRAEIIDNNMINSMEESALTENRNGSPEDEDPETPEHSSLGSAHRLTTVHEESTAVSPSNIQELVASPLLSGIFNEVRVYVSPLENMPRRTTGSASKIPHPSNTPERASNYVTTRRKAKRNTSAEQNIVDQLNATASTSSDLTDVTLRPTDYNNTNHIQVPIASTEDPTSENNLSTPSLKTKRTNYTSTPYSPCPRSFLEFSEMVTPDTPKETNRAKLPTCKVNLVRYSVERKRRSSSSQDDSRCSVSPDKKLKRKKTVVAVEKKTPKISARKSSAKSGSSSKLKTKKSIKIEHEKIPKLLDTSRPSPSPKKARRPKRNVPKKNLKEPSIINSKNLTSIVPTFVTPGVAAESSCLGTRHLPGRSTRPKNLVEPFTLYLSAAR